MQPKINRQKRRVSRPTVAGFQSPRDLSLLVAHTLETLPDSMARRVELLDALAACIPPDMESGLLVRLMRFHLEEHRKLDVGVASPEE